MSLRWPQQGSLVHACCPILQTHSRSGGIPRVSAQNYGRPHKALAQSKHGVTCATFCWPNNHISKLTHVYPQGEEVDAIL